MQSEIIQIGIPLTFFKSKHSILNLNKISFLFEFEKNMLIIRKNK